MNDPQKSEIPAIMMQLLQQKRTLLVEEMMKFIAETSFHKIAEIKIPTAETVPQDLHILGSGLPTHARRQIRTVLPDNQGCRRRNPRINLSRRLQKICRGRHHSSGEKIRCDSSLKTTSSPWHTSSESVVLPLEWLSRISQKLSLPVTTLRPWSASLYRRRVLQHRQGILRLHRGGGRHPS